MLRSIGDKWYTAAVAADPVNTIVLTRHQWRIMCLIAAQIVAIFAISSVRDNWLYLGIDVSAVLEFAQVTLLSVWCALGHGRWWMRLLLSYACVVAIVVIKDGTRVSFMARAWYTLETFAMNFAMATLGWLTAAIGLAMARTWGPRFEIVRVGAYDKQRPPLQFSILSLMIVTVITAVVLTVARPISEAADASRLQKMLTFFCFFAPAIATYSAALAVALVWAGLGESHVGLRVTIAIVLQLSLWLLFRFLVSRDSLTWQNIGVPIAGHLAQSALVVGSLLVVRSCGYRVVSRSATEKDAGVARVHPLD